MCEICANTLGRRQFLGLAGGAAAAMMMASPALASGDAGPGVTPDEALKRLVDGNAKFVSAPQECVADLAASRANVAKGQKPWAAILGCADSRVPPELLFGGLNVGELFVARNAGNMADTATMGTLEYGAEHLGVPLIVVLGHERCGAVAAACEVVEKKVKLPGSIGPMVNAIVPAAKAAKAAGGDFVDATVRESAKRTAALVAKSPIISHLIHEGKVKVVAGRYDLDEGKVEFFA